MQSGHPIRFSYMSDENETKPHKQLTQAIAEQPQEEFISPVNRPSKPETDAEKSTTPTQDHEPPRH